MLYYIKATNSETGLSWLLTTYVFANRNLAEQYVLKLKEIAISEAKFEVVRQDKIGDIIEL